MIKSPRGTKDIFGTDVRAWQWLESHIRNLCDLFGFGEIRTPIFEHTELFSRGVGETTDVVQKEMYTFNDKGNRSITLKPEGTGGVARAFNEHGMHNAPMPVKLYYLTPCFRYEKPQDGRLRQHHQFGVETIGSPEPEVEAEIIALGYQLLNNLGLTGVKVFINSLGCTTCRGAYKQALQTFIGDNLPHLCEDCNRRFEKNPLRILDCKVDSCKKIVQSAPVITDFLDDECSAHFKALQALLSGLEIPFEIDPKIVRGLDYYNRTVFEFIIPGLLTVIGGGRYDGLVEQIGEEKTDKKTPAVGFGMGMDRLLLLLSNQNLLPAPTPLCDIYIGFMGVAGRQKAQTLIHALRQNGISAEGDLLARGVKAQMKYANKLGAKFSLIIGENELETNQATLKNMETKEQHSTELTAAAIIKTLGLCPKPRKGRAP
ncbi:MAG: histidine--tRNA ligase [Turicibacter sp.]|nr:histidine--tRNA ligase [Turicibacter sp.]